MHLLLRRHPATDGAILGDLFFDGTRECFTLEREDLAIPLGRYRVTITKSQRFGRMLPLVNGVPDRSGIRIHPGNTEHDTEGCILVGRTATLGTGTIGESRLAMDALQAKLAWGIARGEQVWLTIEAPTAPGVNA
jgi:hypothetical protein